MIFEEIGGLEHLRLEARLLGNGFVYLLDGRTPDPGGRVPPEDILGAVEVQGGEMVTGSFQHNPRHRLLTSRGFFQLPQQLEAALVSKLRARSGPDKAEAERYDVLQVPPK